MDFIIYLYLLTIYSAIITDLNNFDDSFYILIVSTIKLFKNFPNSNFEYYVLK